MSTTKIADPARLHYYYYEHIAENEQKAYEIILEGYKNMEDQIDLSPLDISIERIYLIHDMVLRDHPELFWTNASYSFEGSYNSNVKKILPNYTMTEAERQRCQREIDAELDNFRKVLKGRMKDYDAALKIYERMVELLDYDSLGLARQERLQKKKKNNGTVPDHLRSIYGALVQKKVVCAGYAKGYQYILQSLGLECTAVLGTCRGRGYHQWCIVRLNGKYYHVDVTWGDRSNTDQSKSSEGISYNYFCLTDQEMLKSRIFDKTLPLPACTATKCNYFRMKDLYIANYDEKLITEKIRTQLKKKKKRKIHLRFSSSALMKKVENAYLKNNLIFSILREEHVRESTVWHSANKDLNVLTIWLDGWK